MHILCELSMSNSTGNRSIRLFPYKVYAADDVSRGVESVRLFFGYLELFICILLPIVDVDNLVHMNWPRWTFSIRR